MFVCALTWSSPSQTGEACVSRRTPAWLAGRVALWSGGQGPVDTRPMMGGCSPPTEQTEELQECLNGPWSWGIYLEEDERKNAAKQHKIVQDKLRVMSTCWFLPLEICSADSCPSNPEHWATLSAIDFKELGGSWGWREWKKKKNTLWNNGQLKVDSSALACS